MRIRESTIEINERLRLMSRRVLSVGQCAPDHASICRFLTRHFQVEVIQSDSRQDALRAIRQGDFDLVLINRKLDADYSDGIEILRQIKADEKLQDVPVMLVTNFAEHHQTAVEAGGEAGFGKSELGDPRTAERLRPFLS